jgi:putative transposase
MVHQYQQKIGLKNLCQWVQLPLSSFHYKPLKGKPGAKPSLYTKMLDGKVVVNEEVIGSIKKLLSEEFVCYGYKKVSASLKQLKYLINDKKVYRLMDENNLLLGKVIRTTGKRQFVKHRKITATCPMDYLCLDIKYLWVHGEQRWYYLLSVIDVFSRKIIAWILQRSIKQIDVINIFRRINQQHPIKGVNIRNDNGSQFLANSVKIFIK